MTSTQAGLSIMGVGVGMLGIVSCWVLRITGGNFDPTGQRAIVSRWARPMLYMEKGAFLPMLAGLFLFAERYEWSMWMRAGTSVVGGVILYYAATLFWSLVWILAFGYHRRR